MEGSTIVLDIGGYLTSREFVSGLAVFIATLFSAIFQGIIAELFGAT
jgi:hypothetical protein